MAGRLTLWGAGELLRSFISRTAEPPPSFFLALIKEIPPTPYVSGGELDEPSVDDGYQRVELPNDAATWSGDDELHLVSNQADVPFVTATSDWGPIGFWAICNALEGGYVYFVGDMEDSQIIYTGDQAVIPAQELVIQVGPFYTDEEL